MRADNLAIEADCWPIVEREYVWFPAGMKSRDDPLGQWAAAGIKFWVDEPRSKHDARVAAEIAEGGWRPLSRPVTPGRHWECADFRLNGKTERYWREERA